MTTNILSNLCLSVAYLLTLWAKDQDFVAAINQLGPVLLLASCLRGAYKSFAGKRFSLFTPLPWFYLAYGVYFGFAPLIYHFGTPESIEYCDYFYPVNEMALLRTNILNTVGIVLILLGYKFTALIFRDGKYLVDTPSHGPITLQRICFLFITIGLTIKFVFAFPYYMGWISWTLPGFVQSLATLPRIAIVLIFILIFENSLKLKWLLYALVAEELTVALMTLSKLAVIEVILSVLLGWIVTCRPNLKKLTVSATALVILYVLILSPFVTYARILSGAVGVGSVGELAQSISTYSTTADQEDLNKVAGISSGVQGWWTRLVYTNAQTFAMVDYDSGGGGSTIALALYAFIPRFLYPDKPTMTPGRDFTSAIEGNYSETATAAGVLAEAYWNGGWGLVICIGLFLGMLFRAFSLFATKTLASRQFEYLPIVFVGITQGYSVCDWFAATYVGPIANVIALFVLVKYIAIPVLSRSKRASNPIEDPVNGVR